MTVSTFTATNVVAPLGVDVAPGTYTLTLVNNTLAGGVDKRSATFPVTLGAVGPQGPPGPQGPAGPSDTSTTSTTSSTSGTTSSAPTKTSGTAPAWISAALPGTLQGTPATPWTAATVIPDQAIAITRVTGNHSESAVFSPRGWAVLEPGVLDPLPNCDCWLVN